MVPSIVLLLPLYLAMKTLGLVNSHFGLVISYLTITLAVCNLDDAILLCNHSKDNGRKQP